MEAIAEVLSTFHLTADEGGSALPVLSQTVRERLFLAWKVQQQELAR